MAKEEAIVTFLPIATCLYRHVCDNKKNQRMHINARKIAQDRRHPRQQMLTRAIRYDTSSRQMKASAELSAECHQSFQ